MVQDKAFFIVNPIAGGRKVKPLWEKIVPFVKKKLGPLHYEWTESASDSERLTRLALHAGYSSIMAVGGDGTLNGCLNGFLEDDKPVNPKATLGILPMGRGSDFARSLRISRKPLEVLDQFQKTKSKPIDVGKVTYVNFEGKKTSRYFINMASVGIVGNVVNWANKAPSFLGAQGSYFYGIIRGLLEFHPRRVLCVVGKTKKEEEVLMIVIANSRYFGSGIPVAPRAMIEDGFFDVMTFKPLGFFSLLRHLPQLYSGKHLRQSQVNLTRTQRIDIQPIGKNANLFVEADGDTIGELPATFEILPKAIRFLVPLV